MGVIKSHNEMRLKESVKALLFVGNDEDTPHELADTGIDIVQVQNGVCW
jgi:hypothetical protein